MTRPQPKRPGFRRRLQMQYPSINGSTVLTFTLVSLAMLASWSIALIAMYSTGPSSAAEPTTATPPGTTTTTVQTTDTGDLEVAIPAAAIAEPLVVTPQTGSQTGLATSIFNVSTSRSIAFETLLATRTVYLVGDSLALSASDELKAIFGDRLTVDAETNLGLYSAEHRIDRAAADPDIVIIALGTNDFNAPEAFNESARVSLETLEAASCVVWVDTQEFEPGLGEINSGLLDLADEFDLYVAGWSAWAGSSELHTADGYHLSSAGQQLFADLIAATVETNCLRAGS